MNWKAEALVQNILSHLYGRQQFYYLGQRVVGGFRQFNINSKVQQSAMLLDSLTKVGVEINGKDTVEIGTGWVPIIPIFLWLHGQNSCNTIDVTRLLRPSLVSQAVQQFLDLIEDEQNGLFEKVVPSRWHDLRSLPNTPDPVSFLNTVCNIQYHAPCDTGASNLPTASADIVYSNTVLEHVPEWEIPRVFAEAHRLLRPNGYMVHNIDLSDHFSHSDAKLSPIHFLTLSESAFSKYNNQILYQNRWRAEQYRHSIELCQFDICYWSPIVNEKLIHQVPQLSIHADFAHLSPQQLATTGVRVVAQRRN